MTEGKGRGKENPPKDEINTQPVRYDISMLSNDDLFLFNEGSHYRLYEKLGAHPITVDGSGRNLFRRVGT